MKVYHPNLAVPDTIRDKRFLISLHAARIDGNKKGRIKGEKEMQIAIKRVRLIRRLIVSQKDFKKLKQNKYT